MKKDRLPDSEVKIRMATCGKCKNWVYTAVEHLMDKDSHKEMAKCVEAGCEVTTIPLLEYRKMKIGNHCNTECK